VNVSEDNLPWLSNMGEGTPPQKHFVEHQTASIDIGASIDGLSLRLLRRHVARRSKRHARCCDDLLGLFLELSDPKIEKLGDPRAGLEEVLRFDISMDNMGTMSRVEASKNVQKNGSRIVRREPLSLTKQLSHGGAL
jgi:hypothetical protein